MTFPLAQKACSIAVGWAYVVQNHAIPLLGVFQCSQLGSANKKHLWKVNAFLAPEHVSLSAWDRFWKFECPAIFHSKTKAWAIWPVLVIFPITSKRLSRSRWNASYVHVLWVLPQIPLYGSHSNKSLLCAVGGLMDGRLGSSAFPGWGLAIFFFCLLGVSVC